MKHHGTDETCTLFDQGLASETTSRTYRKVNSTLLDVALNKPTSPSTHYSYLSSDRAVDGDLGTQYYSVDKNNPWWRVDLGQNYCIQLIDVLPHREVPSWFHSVEIRAGVTPADGDFSGYTLVASFPGPHVGVDRLLFTPPGVLMARYISIQIKATSDFLNIQDVKVMALVMEDY
ncbi:uncharacterized protein LOC122260918 [Penaeus japonicus]|uniref:uncharacterized protein LOC122260918 n=1 Tax=Penaeus japonicus TaxID=27405 RepID=UPI001C714267|nr:uncharacterized protein LOC122260918 [Penaeus japonicus]